MATNISPTAQTHSATVSKQFETAANAYLTSAVHASGEDLEALAGLAKAQPQAQVLDMGCGAGHVSFAVASHVKSVTAYDLTQAMLEVVAQSAVARGLSNIVTRQGDVSAMPFADETFDLVLTRYSAHHWRDFSTALREAARVLKSGGIFVAVDVAAPESALADTWLQSVELLRDPSHVRDYSVAEWASALAVVGLGAGAPRSWKIHLQFDAWVKRMRTPEERVAAISSLWRAAPDEVREYFSVQQDGSFSPDVVWIDARKI